MWAALAAVLALAALPGAGQGLNGSITGIVVDPSRAAVTGAEVLLTAVESGLQTRAKTNSAGAYRFASVPLGGYRLRIEIGGFKTYVQDGIVVETAETVRVDAALEIGAVQDSITVTAEAPLLDRETSNLGTQVSAEMVDSLPHQLTGGIRNPLALVRLTPGAEGTSGAGDGTRIAGSRTYANEVMLDGIPFSYNATQNVAGPTAPALETVAQFRVETAIAAAEYGRTASGAVLMASRSGTNQVRGNLFALFRNGIFDARRYNAAVADITRQGEFGGSLGGPVRIPRLYDGSNRTFFFGNYTGFRRLSEVQGRTATLPTEAMRRGDFSQVAQRIYDPSSGQGGGQRQQFPANVIPASRLSQFARTFQAMLPLPNAPGLSDNYLGSMPSTLNLDSWFIKLDHSFSDRSRLSGSFRSRSEQRVSGNGFVLPISDFIHQGIEARNVTLAHDWILRPNLLNRVQMGLTRVQSAISESGDAGLGVPGAYESGFPGLAFQGQGMTPFGFGNDRTTTNNNFNLQETVAWTAGTHNTKFGFRIDNYQYNLRQMGFREGQYTFTQFTTGQPQVNGTGHSYASFVLGLASNGNMAYNSPTGDRSRYFGFFAQDDWKITRRLTLNYGYRFEFQTPFREAHNRLSTMDPAMPNPGAGGYPGAVIFAGDGPGRSGKTRFIETYYGAHAPRLGLAYQASKHTVVRAGAGLFYSPLIGLDNDKTGWNARVTRTSVDAGAHARHRTGRGVAGRFAPVPAVHRRHHLQRRKHLHHGEPARRERPPGADEPVAVQHPATAPERAGGGFLRRHRGARNHEQQPGETQPGGPTLPRVGLAADPQHHRCRGRRGRLPRAVSRLPGHADAGAARVPAVPQRQHDGLAHGEFHLPRPVYQNREAALARPAFPGLLRRLEDHFRCELHQPGIGSAAGPVQPPRGEVDHRRGRPAEADRQFQLRASLRHG